MTVARSLTCSTHLSALFNVDAIRSVGCPSYLNMRDLSTHFNQKQFPFEQIWDLLSANGPFTGWYSRFELFPRLQPECGESCHTPLNHIESPTSAESLRMPH